MDTDQIAETLGKLSIAEALALTRRLEQDWGVTSAPITLEAKVQVPSPTHVPEQTIFAVEMTDAGPNKVQAIKLVREVTGLPLKEAKDFVDGLPKVLKDDLNREDAQAFLLRLGDTGAKGRMV